MIGFLTNGRWDSQNSMNMKILTNIKKGGAGHSEVSISRQGSHAALSPTCVAFLLIEV